ncbi:TetR family transcriptional regulator [Paenibacillus arenilitoris]|uniref:TetR/AcrR family transcriptional regulator n=1 Tax=Paenibacillus arenilitoris TaxID=2772299 RepID=A0A927H7X6_9BACL|nr:TetR family transcriptional regulator [Paenibacillus arenilitoris]MBD2870992.1 TetR/AcrR family transcriptional regulator [Paenibacillus arenilitoris]
MTTGDADIKMRILLAAKKLFAQHGFEKTTVRQICEEAGANVALVSYYFGGKENMFGALFETFFPNDQLATVDPTLDPVEGVKLIIREVTAFRNSDNQLISIIQQEIIMNTDRIQKIRQHVMPIWRMLRHWLAQGREQGLFHFRSLDNALMAVVGTLLFHRNTDYWSVILEEGQPTSEALAEDLTVFVLGALQYTGE